MSYPPKKLGEVCEIEYGTRIVKSRNTPGQYYVYGGGGKTFTTNTYNRENRVIISRFGMSPNCVRRVHGKFFLNDSGLTLSPRDDKELAQDYLDFFLFSFEQKIYDLGRGQAQRNLSMDEFKELEIPLPPLSEQKKIVAKLERVLAKINEVKKLRAEARESADNLLPAELHKIFEEGEKRGWAGKKLKDLCADYKQDIVDGPFGSDMKRRDYLVSGIPVLKIQNVKEYRLEIKKIDFVSDSKAKELVRHSYRAGDIVMTKLGEPLGISAIVSGIDDGIIVADLIRVRAHKIDTKYLCYFLNSEKTKEFINSQQKGTTRKRIKLSVIRELPILVPSLAEQKKIVARLDSLSEKIASLRQAQAKTQSDLAALEQSVLSVVFN